MFAGRQPLVSYLQSRTAENTGLFACAVNDPARVVFGLFPLQTPPPRLTSTTLRDIPNLENPLCIGLLRPRMRNKKTRTSPSLKILWLTRNSQKSDLVSSANFKQPAPFRLFHITPKSQTPLSAVKALKTSFPEMPETP